MSKRSARNVPLSAAHREQLARLSECELPPGSWDAEFVRTMTAKPEGTLITIGQSEWVNRLMHRHRAQLAAAVQTGALP